MDHVALPHHMQRCARVHCELSFFVADSCLGDSSCNSLCFLKPYPCFLAASPRISKISVCFTSCYSCLLCTNVESTVDANRPKWCVRIAIISGSSLDNSFAMVHFSLYGSVFPYCDMLLCWLPSNFPVSIVLRTQLYGRHSIHN